MNKPTYFHYGHSTVQLLPSGILREIRRGYGLPKDIQNPMNWTSVEQWMQFASSLVIQYPFNEHWTPDQIWLAQWFRNETLQCISGKDFMEFTANCILELREKYSRKQTTRILHKLQYHEKKYKEVYLDINKLNYKVINKQIPPKILIQDECGYLHNVYMCLTTGAIAIDSAENVGTSFAELGVQPTAIFNREYGVYYRVL